MANKPLYYHGQNGPVTAAKATYYHGVTPSTPNGAAPANSPKPLYQGAVQPPQASYHQPSVSQGGQLSPMPPQQPSYNNGGVNAGYNAPAGNGGHNQSYYSYNQNYQPQPANGPPSSTPMHPYGAPPAYTQGSYQMNTPYPPPMPEEQALPYAQQPQAYQQPPPPQAYQQPPHSQAYQQPPQPQIYQQQPPPQPYGYAGGAAVTPTAPPQTGPGASKPSSNVTAGHNGTVQGGDNSTEMMKKVGYYLLMGESLDKARKKKEKKKKHGKKKDDEDQEVALEVGMAGLEAALAV